MNLLKKSVRLHNQLRLPEPRPWIDRETKLDEHRVRYVELQVNELVPAPEITDPVVSPVPIYEIPELMPL